MLRAQLGGAVMLLTRLPAGWLIGDRAVPAPHRCFWAYPLVGAAIGAAGGAVFTLCRAASLPPSLAACWTVAGLVVVTGALHEDGLGDMADGFGGGRTRERKLEIMRDSRVGSYGVLALVLAVAIRAAAIAAIPHVLPALIASGALSRAAMAVPALLPPARVDGLGAGMGRIGWGPTLSSAAIGGAVALLALPPGSALLAVAVAGCAALATAWVARAQIGGFTGDVLGGCAVVTECAVLSCLV